MKSLLLLIAFFSCFLAQINFGATSSALKAQHVSVADILESKRAVLRIFSITNNSFRSGTGFLVSNDGLIVTNSHVVHNATSLIVYVLNEDGTAAYEHTAKIVQEDIDRDFAIIRLDRIPEYLPAPFVLSKTKAEVLEEVLALGFPSALDRPLSVASELTGGIITDSVFLENLDPNVTKGAISKVGMWLVHDAKISAGNSGGPLVSMQTGEVVGINTAKTQGATSFYMAIPIDAFRMKVEILKGSCAYTEELEEGAANGDLKATVSLAFNLYSGDELDKRDPQRALALMEQAASEGSQEALYFLGLMYSENKGIKPNPSLAIKYLKEGNTDDCKLLLARLYLDGISGSDFTGDPKKGFNIVKELADSTNSPSARSILADCYRIGLGTPRNLDEAVRLCRQLLEEEKKSKWGSVVASQYGLAITLLKYDDKKHIDEGISLLKELTSDKWDYIKGKACLKLGELYTLGQKVKKDYKMAAFYFHLGSEANDHLCMANLGAAYIKGNGVPQDPDGGIALIYKAIELGASDQCYGPIGSYLWKQGRGNEAVPLLQKAAAAGDDKSACELAYLYYTGDAGVKIKRQEAIKILRRVASQSPDAANRKLANDLLASFGQSKKSGASRSSQKRKGSAKPTSNPRPQPLPATKRW